MSKTAFQLALAAAEKEMSVVLGAGKRWQDKMSEYNVEDCSAIEAELATLKKKARAAVNAPYDDALDMGLAQALRELGEVLG